MTVKVKKGGPVHMEIDAAKGVRVVLDVDKNCTMRKSDALYIAGYFERLAEILAPDEMHPNDVGITPAGTMRAADLGLPDEESDVCIVTLPRAMGMYSTTGE